MTNAHKDPEAPHNSINANSSDQGLAEGSPDYAVGALEGLVSKIADGQAIVYIGAGASQSANLPSWADLLAKLQEEASNRLKNQKEPAAEYFRELKNRSRNLELGDWLLRLLGPEFQQVISRVLSEDEDLCAIEPSPIHWNVLRSPFKMAITTNYDLILEKAYDDAYHVCPIKLPYLTWKHTDEILRAASGKSFRIVHAHGTVGDSNSIVLSGSQYTMLHNVRPRFEDVLKHFLKSFTFLFVGAGLEDPDLIYILQEAIAENAGVVGPHYALLPYTEAPQIRRDILRESLHIEVIPVGNKNLRKEWEKNQNTEKSRGRRRTHWMTPAASSILRALAGGVARHRFRRNIAGSPTSDDPDFCLDLALVALLKQAIEATGSFRGDICLSPDGIDSHLSGVLEYAYSQGATTGEVIRKRVDPSSICGIAYHESDTRRGVYVKDVTSKDLAAQIKDSSRTHYGGIRYVSGDGRVKSELAIPIEADGVRVGVLNLESNLTNAYGEEEKETRDFLEVARRFAEKAGRLYAAAHDRDRRSARLGVADNRDTYKMLRDLCAQLWCLARGLMPPSRPEQPLELLIYRARYKKGELVSQNPKETILYEKPGSGLDIPAQCFPFAGIKENERNRFLATRAFLDGRPYYYPDACKAIMNGNIHNIHCLSLGLSRRVNEDGEVPEGLKDHSGNLIEHALEPLIGFPVLIHGRAAGVVVVWNFRGGGERTHFIDSLDSRDIEVFRRATHLMANHFDWSLRIESPKDKDESSLRPPGIKIAQDIVACLKTSSGDLAGNTEKLDEVGESYRQQIGPAVLRFLYLLRQNEYDFSNTFARGLERPTDWITPVRCRCWVRIRPVAADAPIADVPPQSEEDALNAQTLEKHRKSNLPIFALAFELTLEKLNSGTRQGETTMDKIAQSWRNRFETTVEPLNHMPAENKTVGIIMEPFSRPRPEENKDEANPRQTKKVVITPLEKEEQVTYWSRVASEPGEVEWKHKTSEFEVFADNPHMSFLLSRISVYPYAFQQVPRVIGNDIMAEKLDKNPDLPWFVAPIIVFDNDLWRDTKNLDPTASPESSLAGYLTVDSGPGFRKWKEAAIEKALEEQREGKTEQDQQGKKQKDNRIEVMDDWAKFQNDMLHEMSLFTACLAQQPCLRNLVIPQEQIWEQQESKPPSPSA